MELLILDSIGFIQTEVLFMWPTFHSCIPSPSHVLIPKCVSICACMRVCVCAITSEGRVCVLSVCACASVEFCASQPPCTVMLVRLSSRCS